MPTPPEPGAPHTPEAPRGGRPLSTPSEAGRKGGHPVGAPLRGSSVLLDEIPAAYKDIDQVMEHARDLVEVKYVLKQFVNVKGD